MARRCTLTQHSNCNICNTFVGPWSGYHIHTSPSHNKPAGIICTECYGIILTASQFILRALQQAGIGYTSQKELRERLSEYVTLGIQLDLPQN